MAPPTLATPNETSSLLPLGIGNNSSTTATATTATIPTTTYRQDTGPYPEVANNNNTTFEWYGSRQNYGSLRDHLTSSIRVLSTRVGSFIAHHTGTIGMVGSFSIAVNSLTGPAMLGLPGLFARSGIIPTVTTVLVVACLCAFCSLHMANTISKVNNNRHFTQQVEYSDAFRIFFNRSDDWFKVTQVVFYGCILCLNISSIVDTAQVVDTFFGHWWPWGGTAAIQISPETLSISLIRWDYSFCTVQEIGEGSCTPFSGSEGTIFTLGTLVTNLFFLPLALLPLKENAWWQVVAFLTLLMTSVFFIVTFLSVGLDFSRASLWGDNWDDLFGVVLFNFALVIAIPAWLYEREPHVDVPTVVHGSCALSSFLYISIGILGQLAMPDVSDNMIQSMMSGALGIPLQLAASIFEFAIVGLGIPLFSVLTRLNLVGSGLCSKNVGNLLAVYFPFGVSWFLYDSTAVTKLLSWGGMIFTSLIAFIFPLWLAIHVNKEYEGPTGAVDVCFGLFKGKAAELLSLRLLLVFAITAIVIAIAGNVM